MDSLDEVKKANKEYLAKQLAKREKRKLTVRPKEKHKKKKIKTTYLGKSCAKRGHGRKRYIKSNLCYSCKNGLDRMKNAFT